MYAVGRRLVHSRATFELYELADDLIAWSTIMKLDLNESSSINRTSDVASIRISVSEKEAPAASQSLLLGTKYLLVRQSSTGNNDPANASRSSTSPITRHAFLQELDGEFMIVNRSALNLDNRDICRVRFNAKDPAVCSMECSDEQPIDFWLRDKVNSSFCTNAHVAGSSRRMK